jgi:hypothetical protein
MKAESNIKTEIYRILNDIQTRTNTSDNLDSFIKIYQKNKEKEFNESLENVFLIIMKNFDKNNVVLKNIKEFIKLFLDKIVKITKLRETTKRFLNNFCQLFTMSTKKPKYKNLCIYFLSNTIIIFRYIPLSIFIRLPKLL